jgi:hypothetical protein
MKALSKSSVRRALLVLAMLAASVALTTPFFLHRTPSGETWWMISTHDMRQHLAVMKDFDKVIRAGTPYPRWLPDINGGYGIPWMNFYPPGFYYLASLVNAVVKDWVNTVFAISVLGFVASGLAFYVLARTFYTRSASAIGAALYLTAPYHVLDLYWRGAMPEFIGFILVPLIIYFAFKTVSTGKARHLAGLGFFHGVFLMTHIPVAFLMTYALGLLGIAWAVKERNWRIAARVAAGIVIALAISAIYLLPAALEIKDAQEHFSKLFPYHASYITLMRGADAFGDVMNVAFVANVVALVIAIIVLRVARRYSTAESEPLSTEPATRLWVMMGITTAFMCTSFSIYFSKLLPKIDVASFAWRWLVIACLFTSLLIAAAIDYLSRHSNIEARRLWLYRALIAAAIGLNIWITVGRVINGTLTSPPLDTTTNYIEAGFTPRGSADPHALPDTPPVTIQPEGGTSEVMLWQPYHRQIGVKVEQSTRVRLKTFNFPGWTALVDGEPTPMLSDQDGVQVVDVSPGAHLIEASFVNTPIRTLGALLSALGLLVAIGLVALDRIRETKRVAAGSTSRKALPVRLLKPFAAIAAILLIGAVTLLLLTSRGRSGRPPPTTSNVSAKGASATSGSEASLHIDGVPSILVALDERALDELMNALAARDNSKVDSLAQSGQVLRVAIDTRVRVLASGSGKIRIRILQGEHSMAEGWVPERWVR